MPRISVVQASLLYQVTNKTVYSWIKADSIQKYADGQYELDDLQAAYDKRHPQTSKTLKSYKKWIKENPDKAYAKVRNFQSANLEKSRQALREWLSDENNQNEYLTNVRAKREANPYRLRNDRLRNVPKDKWTPGLIVALFGTLCHLCKKEIDLKAPRRKPAFGWQNGLQIDHVIPVAKGGHDTIDNLRPSHAGCNQTKGMKLI